MSYTIFRATSVDFCPSCKGVWLDRGEIDKVARMEDARDEEQYYQRYRRRQDGDYDDDYDYSDDYHHDRGDKRRRRGFLGELFDFD